MNEQLLEIEIIKDYGFLKKGRILKFPFKSAYFLISRDIAIKVFK